MLVSFIAKLCVCVCEDTKRVHAQVCARDRPLCPLNHFLSSQGVSAYPPLLCRSTAELVLPSLLSAYILLT